MSGYYKIDENDPKWIAFCKKVEEDAAKRNKEEINRPRPKPFKRSECHNSWDPAPYIFEKNN